jgi:dipeptidase E
MKLYLSSFKLGNHTDELVKMVGENKHVGVVTNSRDGYDQHEVLKRVELELDSLSELGFTPEIVDLRKYFGKKDELRKVLSKYGMVYVLGGNTFVLRRAYAYSGLDEILKEKLTDNDFVYAGYSAGICILSPSLRGLDIVDDPNLVPENYKPEIIWDGLGFINYVIEPHYRSDHPESADVEKEVQHCIDNKMLFITLRDGEVIRTEITELAPPIKIGLID